MARVPGPQYEYSWAASFSKCRACILREAFEDLFAVPEVTMPRLLEQLLNIHAT